MNNVKTTENTQLSTQARTFFEIIEGSNYLVRMTYDENEIISFEQFKKLANALFKGSSDFVTVNGVIVQKKDIRMIKPTKELTKEQAKEAERKALEYRKLETRKDELSKLKTRFDFEFFNEKYGAGKWVRYRFGNKGNEILLSEKDFKEANEAFEKQYPQENEEIEKISENR